ncbi:MAG: ABC transporter ATP-binding protein [Clostridiales bacterium]|nr:ABC transporter ATP-binding protein [Clostridiales bacterium]
MCALIVNTKGLVKSFGNVFALNELNFCVPKGISGFIGKNGAGKTTTIGILLGLLKPDQGEATIFGLDCRSDSYEIRRRIGIMHEVIAYPNNFSGIHFLEYVAKIYGNSQPEKKAREVIKDVGLNEAGKKRISKYSAGMLRRLGLAQALIGDPEMIILDEPTANIDPIGRIELLKKINEMHKENGTSFLISTHILSDLEKICNWLSIIDEGKIVDQGSVKDLAEKCSANIYKIEVPHSQLFADKVQALECVDKVWIEKGKVYCKVKDQTIFTEELLKITTELKAPLKEFSQMMGTLEEIYTKTLSEKKNAF